MIFRHFMREYESNLKTTKCDSCMIPTHFLYGLSNSLEFKLGHSSCSWAEMLFPLATVKLEGLVCYRKIHILSGNAAEKWSQRKQESIRSSCNTDVQLGTRAEWEDTVIPLPCTLLHFSASYFIVGLLRCPISCWHEMLGTFCTIDSILRYLASSHSSYFIWRSKCWFLMLLLGFPYCTQQSQPQSLALGFSPVLHPGLTRKLWNAPILTITCFLLPNHEVSQTLVSKSLLSYSRLSLFYLMGHLYCISSTELSFSSLPCETCHNQLLPESASFPCGLEMDPFFHSCLLLMKKTRGESRCINICSGPERARNTCYKET